jgi:hypothetical protein
MPTYGRDEGKAVSSGGLAIEPILGGDLSPVHSHHDTQECSIAGTDRDDFGHCSFGVHIRLQLRQCVAGIGSSANAVSVVHLCVCVLHRGGLLLHVPQGTVVMLASAWRVLLGIAFFGPATRATRIAQFSIYSL